MRSACSVLLLVLAGCGAATSATHDDFSISTRVKIALLNDPRVALLRIDAKTFQGVVTLTGTVASQGEIDEATGVARSVSGVREVRSALKIGGGQTLTSLRSRSDRVAHPVGPTPAGHP